MSEEKESYHTSRRIRHPRHRKSISKKSGEASFFSGLAFSIAFGVVWYATKQGFWVFPLVFAGLLPMIRGFRYFVERRSTAPKTELDAEVRAEKEVLKIARDKSGRVTPTMIALESYLSIETAEKVLELLAKKGYTRMEVTEDGRVVYEFPEFLPEKR